MYDNHDGFREAVENEAGDTSGTQNGFSAEHTEHPEASNLPEPAQLNTMPAGFPPPHTPPEPAGISSPTDANPYIRRPYRPDYVHHADREDIRYGRYSAPRSEGFGKEGYIPGRRRKKSGNTAVKVVGISLAVLVLIIVSAVIFMGESPEISIDWSRPPDSQGENDGGIFFSPPVLDYGDTAKNQPELPRAETGTGIVLEILDVPDTDTLTTQEIYKKCSPSVVGITASEDSYTHYWGTGVILTSDGYIITNSHIIDGTSSVTVTLEDDTTYEARLVGSDTPSDLAVLKIDADGLTPAQFGDSSALEVGEEVVAIGNPLGIEFRGTLTNGVISAINRDIVYEGYTMTLLQTNAAINEGNSGGPLINMHGQVIGITNMKMISYYSSVEGIAFAIPTASMKSVVDELIEFGELPPVPIIGISGLPAEEGEHSETSPAGVYIKSVETKSDAYKKGVRAGDIVTMVNGEEVLSVSDVNDLKTGLLVGESLTLTVYRDGEYLEFTITLHDASDFE